MSAKVFRFGPFRFNAERDLLYRDGRPLALGGKAAILLRMLLNARGDVVSKSELMDAAWPSPDAEISNLTVQITALRRCLGDNRKCPTWIETLHGVGYRFAGSIEIADDRADVQQSPTSRDWPVVTLMPFQLLDGASLHPHVADGFHDRLVAELSRLPIHVLAAKYPAATESPFSNRDVDYRIGGRIRIRQRELRVEIAVSPRRSRKASETVSVFEGDLSGLFQLQAELARAIAALIRQFLSETPRLDGWRAGDLAQRHYERGCGLLVRSHAGNRSGRRHLSTALRLDPGFAKAHAFLGIGHYTAAIHYGEDVRANRALALAYADRAVALDPADSTAHGALGFVRLYESQLSESEDSISAARHYDPADTYVLTNLSELRVFQGRHEDAVAVARKAIRENENPPGWYYWDLAFAHYAAGEYAEAVDALSRPGVEMFPGKRILAASLAQLGDIQEAKREAERFLCVHPEFSISRWSETQPFMHRGDRRHFVDGFRKAGFPG